MGGHHLILGKLTDYISGETLDDTLDERHRQRVGRILVENKGYSKDQITSRHAIEVSAGEKCARLLITYTLKLDGRIAMVIQYGPGSLVTRHRPALAMGRTVADYQVPVVVVTNGEQADIIDGPTGAVKASGLDMIPDVDILRDLAKNHPWEVISSDRREMEARILIAYEFDGRCPCDDSVCTIAPAES